MQLLIIVDRAVWDRYLADAVTGAPFLQSAAWGEALTEAGRRTERLAVLTDHEPLLLVQLVYKSLFGPWRYALSPQGPVFRVKGQNDNDTGETADSKWESLTTALTLVRDYLREQGYIFWRVEPTTLTPFVRWSLSRVGDVDPPATLALALTPPPHQLFAGFQPKTRYNIRVAERHGLRVQRIRDFEVFWKLFTFTAERDRFLLHSRSVYEAVCASPAIHQLTIYRGDIPLAVGCFWSWNRTLTYLYGGSNHRYREFMAPSLLQWEGIKLAYELGATTYDFFGVAPTPAPSRERRAFQAAAYPFDQRHRYAGLTRFKLGFGGTVREDPGTFDLPLRSVPYALYRVLRTVRRTI